MFADDQLATTMRRLLEQIEYWGECLRQAMRKFKIDTPHRVVHFLAQIGHESGGLSRTEENLNYSKERLLKVFAHIFKNEEAEKYAGNPIALANRVYAGRNGNGS